MRLPKTFKRGGLLLGAALLIRLLVAVVALDAMPLVSDAVNYSNDAKALLNAFPGETAYYWPPGLPYLLALVYAFFGDSLTTARLLALGISVLNVGMTVCLARLVLREARAVRAAGWLAALYPPAVMMSGQPYSQPLEMLCLLTMSVCLIAGYRRGRWILFGVAGLAFGFGSLVRPSLLSLTFMLVITVALLLRKAHRTDKTDTTRLLLDGSLGFSVAVLLCVVPVMQFQAAHDAGPVLSTNNVRNFFLGNNPYTPLYKTSYLASRSKDQLDPDARMYLDRFATQDAMQQEAWRYVASHPQQTLLRTVNRARAFWGFDYVMSRRIQTHYRLDTVGLGALLVFEAGGYALVMALVLLGLFCAGPLLTTEKKWLLWLVAAYQLPYVAAFATGTYHFSAVGLLLPFAGAGLWVLKDGAFWKQSRRHRRRFAIALTLFFLIQIEYAWFTILYSPADLL